MDEEGEGAVVSLTILEEFMWDCTAQVYIQSGRAAAAQLEHPAMGVIPNITVCVTRTSASSPSSPRGSDRVHMGVGGGWSWRWPVSILGGLILLAALAGFVGAYWSRRRLPLAFYLFAHGSVMLIALLIFAVVVTSGYGGEARGCGEAGASSPGAVADPKFQTCEEV